MHALAVCCRANETHHQHANNTPGVHTCHRRPLHLFGPLFPFRTASLRNGMSHVESLGFWPADKGKKKKRSSGLLVDKLCGNVHVAVVNRRPGLISWTGGRLAESRSCEARNAWRLKSFVDFVCHFIFCGTNMAVNRIKATNCHQLTLRRTLGIRPAHLVLIFCSRSHYSLILFTVLYASARL